MCLTQVSFKHTHICGIYFGKKMNIYIKLI